MARRRASLTHVTHPGGLPQSHLSACYPDFLRRSIKPDRHEVSADESGGELLTESSLSKTTAGATGIEPPGIDARRKAKPTPKKADAMEEARRNHGQRVSDAVSALAL